MTSRPPAILQGKGMRAWDQENPDFDQHLECAVPKHWSKYTTPVDVSILLTSSYQKYLEIREIVKMDLKLKPVDISML